MPEIVFKIISCPLDAVPQVAERLTEFSEKSALELCGRLAEPPAKLILQYDDDLRLDELKQFLGQLGAEFKIADIVAEEEGDRAVSADLSAGEPAVEDRETVSASEITAEIPEAILKSGLREQRETANPAQQPPPLPQYASAGEEPEEILYWERQAKGSVLSALWSTWKASIFSPTEFFRGLPQKGGLGHAFLYALIASVIYTILSLPSAITDVGERMQGLSELQPVMQLLDMEGLKGLSFGPTEITPLTLVRQTLASLFVLPIGLFYFLLLAAGTYHLMVLLVRGRGSFEQTFKVLAYSLSVLAFTAVPIAGTLIIIIYGFAIAVVGFREVHKIQTSAAVMIALAPLFVLFATVLLSFMAAGLTMSM